MATIAATGATIAWISPGEAPLGAVIVLALALGGAPAVIDAGARRRRSRPTLVDRVGTFTTVVRLGTEPAEVARTSIILAARLGPTVVVTTQRRDLLDELGPLAVDVYVGLSPEAALNQAARWITTDAIMIVSASAFPIAEACRIAAGQFAGDVGWATGQAPSPNHDRYAPRERELLAERVRSDARAAGATLWEPDATIIRSDLLVAYPIAPGRPWGHWLRDLQRRGYREIGLETPIALRAAPADAPVFWPSQMMRTRATAADLMGATTSGPVRARILAAGALLRELYACPLALWALVPLLIGWSGAFPLSCAPITFGILVGTLVVARWSATRLVHSIGLHPVHDTRAAAYDAPGSLLALPSALSLTIRPRRIFIPEQPLLWFALAFTLASTLALLQRATTTDSGADIAAGVAVVNIGLLWIIAIRAVGKRGWDRTVYRLHVGLEVTVDGVPAHMMEASPTGCAVTGRFDAIRVGSLVTIVVATGDGGTLQLEGVVANRRASADELVLGLSLQLEPEVRSEWIGVLFGAARHVPPDPRPRATRREARRARGRPSFVQTLPLRLQTLLVGTMSVFAAGALALVLLGFHPLVISSGSMRPTLQIGDVVVTNWVRADHLHVGDIVSFDDPGQSGLFITHRMRTIMAVGPRLRFETRGDANTISEIWVVTPETLVKRTAWQVPVVGGIVADLGSPSARVGLLAASTAIAGALGGLAIRRSRRSRSHRANITSTAPLGAAEPKKRAVPNDSIEPSRPRR